MIRDFDQAENELPDDYDVCIVGTGPAGTTVANELAGSGSRVEEKVFLAASEPQNFGREFRSLFDSSAVDVWLDATLVEFHGERDGSRAREGVVRSSGGREARIRARAFVIATGGIENARLL